MRDEKAPALLSRPAELVNRRLGRANTVVIEEQQPREHGARESEEDDEGKTISTHVWPIIMPWGNGPWYPITRHKAQGTRREARGTTFVSGRSGLVQEEHHDDETATAQGQRSSQLSVSFAAARNQRHAPARDRSSDDHECFALPRTTKPGWDLDALIGIESWRSARRFRGPRAR